MQTMLMAGWLALTLFLIYKVTEDKEKIFVILILYYFITVVNDIFFMSTIELANAFGLSRYGFSAEWMGDLRTNSVFLFSIFYFARFDILQDAKKYRRLLDSVMTIILAISCILWALDILIGFHPLLSQFNATLSDGGSTMRFVQPYEVLGIALYALLLLEENLNIKGYIKFRTILFSAAVILFQHRSIWMAWGCGFIVVLLVTMKNTRITKKLFLQVILLIAFCFIVLNMGSGQLIENISKSFEIVGKMMNGVAIENSTADTRTQVWNAVLEDLSGTALLFGRPYGYGYGRSIGWETSPHSGFIRFLGRTGYIGAGLAICLLIYVVVKLTLKGRNGNAKFLPYLICVIGFMYGYDYTWLCGGVIGLGCMLAYRDYDSLESEV